MLGVAGFGLTIAGAEMNVMSQAKAFVACVMSRYSVEVRKVLN
jgi:hypothetical protein